MEFGRVRLEYLRASREESDMEEGLGIFVILCGSELERYQLVIGVWNPYSPIFRRKRGI